MTSKDDIKIDSNGEVALVSGEEEFWKQLEKEIFDCLMEEEGKVLDYEEALSVITDKVSKAYSLAIMKYEIETCPFEFEFQGKVIF
jgi:hypothetical protein